MSEFSSERVEGDRVLESLSVSNEVEAWALVNDLFDQPGRSQPVDVQIPARDPAPTLVVCEVKSPALRLPRCSLSSGTLRGANGLLRALIRIEGDGATSRTKKVVGSN